MKILFLILVSMASIFAKPIVSVSIPPQEYFVKQIAGDSIEINIVIPPNSDEHNLDFKPKTMAKLEQSDIYFIIGLEFEKALIDKFKNMFKNLHIIDTRENIKLLDTAHNHSHHSDLNHIEFDTHIWLDPILVKTQAENIAKALIAKYPQNKAMYERNLALFQNELDMFHAQIKDDLKDIKTNKFIVYHPSWSYFAKRYNLVQIPVEFEGKEPSPKQLQQLIETAKKEKIKVIFIQKGFPNTATKMIARECGASVQEIDHLSGDWQNELQKSVQTLKNALQ